LQGYKRLVTGGDSAIGRSAAIAYAKEGAYVAINYLPSEEQDAQEVRQVIEEIVQKAVLIPVDIRDDQFNYSLVEQSSQHLVVFYNVTLFAGHQLYHDD
ncbi:SDR family NAD(P)-dependent oxidoreductase, partial [Staphylococcus aureus]